MISKTNTPSKPYSEGNSVSTVILWYLTTGVDADVVLPTVAVLVGCNVTVGSGFCDGDAVALGVGRTMVLCIDDVTSGAGSESPKGMGVHDINIIETAKISITANLGIVVLPVFLSIQSDRH